MKAALPLLALAAAAPILMANDDPLGQTQPAPLLDNAPLWTDPDMRQAFDAPRDCTDTIHRARDERGLPRLDRRPADPNEPILFKALDHEVDGCDVLLVGDGDIRPLPLPRHGPLAQPAQ